MNLSRTLAYATWAFSNVIKIAKDYTNKSIDWVASRRRFNVEITLQGVIMESKSGLTAPEIISLLNTMSNFGNVQIHVTNSGEEDENINRDTRREEQSTVHKESENSSDKAHENGESKDTIHSY
jgi:hypothetical protein|tara:strand:+ start:252 stop:623 length:372 start_codon:yes stop_codon:yes gene_type:complete